MWARLNSVRAVLSVANECSVSTCAGRIEAHDVRWCRIALRDGQPPALDVEVNTRIPGTEGGIYAAPPFAPLTAQSDAAQHRFQAAHAHVTQRFGVLPLRLRHIRLRVEPAGRTSLAIEDQQVSANDQAVATHGFDKGNAFIVGGCHRAADLALGLVQCTLGLIAGIQCDQACLVP